MANGTVLEAATELLEVFGLRFSNSEIGVMEGRNHAANKVRIEVRGEGKSAEVVLSPTAARYIADRLNKVAERVERKAREAKPCGTCGKA